MHFSGRVWWSFTVTIDRYRHMNLKWGPSLMEDQIIIIWGQYSWHHCTLLTGERAPDSLTCINRSRSVDLYKSLMKCVKQKQAAFPDARLDNETWFKVLQFYVFGTHQVRLLPSSFLHAGSIWCCLASLICSVCTGRNHMQHQTTKRRTQADYHNACCLAAHKSTLNHGQNTWLGMDLCAAKQGLRVFLRNGIHTLLVRIIWDSMVFFLSPSSKSKVRIIEVHK